MTKVGRQTTIVRVLEHGPVATQEDLKRALRSRGFRVTQATLSRDIHELGLVKTGEGYELVAPDAPREPVLPPVARLAREFVRDLRPAQNLLVIKTSVGSAQPLAAALDGESWPEIVGTIAGDDTILIVLPDAKSARGLASRIREMLA